MDCSPPGSSVHGILQARIPEWVAILFSEGFTRPRDPAGASCIAGRFFNIWATRERKWKWKWKSQSCLTLCNPMDYTVHGILQARLLEWVVVPFSRGSSQPRNGAGVAYIVGRFFVSWANQGSPRIVEWVSLTLLQRIFPTQNQTGVSCIAGRFFTSWAIREAWLIDQRAQKQMLTYMESKG